MLAMFFWQNLANSVFDFVNKVFVKEHIFSNKYINNPVPRPLNFSIQLKNSTLKESSRKQKKNQHNNYHQSNILWRFALLFCLCPIPCFQKKLNLPGPAEKSTVVSSSQPSKRVVIRSSTIRVAPIDHHRCTFRKSIEVFSVK